MNEKLLNEYWQKGGSYVMPVEVGNEWLADFEDLQVNNQKLNDQLDKELIKRARLEDRTNKAVKYSENLLRELEKGAKLDEIAIIVTFRDILKGEE